jgi:hypothetical protein
MAGRLLAAFMFALGVVGMIGSLLGQLAILLGAK